jgi:hypothetical protein
VVYALQFFLTSPVVVRERSRRAAQGTFVNTRPAGGLVAWQQPRSPRQRVRPGGGDQPLRHPVVDVDEAIERRPLEDADVVERAAVAMRGVTNVPAPSARSSKSLRRRGLKK